MLFFEDLDTMDSDEGMISISLKKSYAKKSHV